MIICGPIIIFYLLAERDMEKHAFFSWGEKSNKKPISSQVVQNHFDSSFLERNHFPPDEKFFVERTHSASGIGARKNYLLCTMEGEILATFGNSSYKDLRAQQRKETVKHICTTLLHLFHK